METNVVLFDRNYFSNKRHRDRGRDANRAKEITGFAIKCCGSPVICSAESKVSPAEVGAVIGEGNILLTTTEDSHLAAAFVDSSSIAISGISQVFIADYNFDHSSSTGEQIIDLLYGELVYHPGEISISDPYSARIRFMRTVVTLRGAAAEFKADAKGGDFLSVKLIPNHDGFTGQITVISPYSTIDLVHPNDVATVDGRFGYAEKNREIKKD